MELDLSFQGKISYLFGDYPKDSSINLDIPTILPSQCTTFLYRNCNPFKEHYLKGSNHHSSFSSVFPSPIVPITMIQTPSYKATHNNESQSESTLAQNPRMFPNNNKLESMIGRLNTSKGVWDLSKKNLFQYGETSQPPVGPNLPHSLVYDAHPSLSVKPEHLGDLSSNSGIENESQENDQGLVRDQNRQKRSQKNRKIQHKDPNAIKGQWTADENSNLIELVNTFGYNWCEIAKFMNGRNGKQCRERWHNHLHPHIKKEPWSKEEEKILIEAHKKLGNKWTKIARMLPGRTDNAIKNHWNTVRRSQTRQIRRNRCDSSKRIELKKYIKEITSTNEVEKDHEEELATQEDEQLGGNDVLITRDDEQPSDHSLEMMLNNGDDGMPMSMDYEFENGMEFFVEVPIKEEMDFMDMICENP